MSEVDMGSGWFYARLGGPPGERVGPLSWPLLVSSAQGGAFGPDDLVWHEQLGEWRPASQIQGLFAAPSGHAVTPAARPSRVLYWLLPVIALVIVGIGLGIYFGLFYGKGTTDTTEPPSTGTTAITAPPSTGTTDRSGAGSVSADELEGVWSGTVAVTEFDLPPETLEQIGQEGCDLSILQALRGMPLPLEMTIEVDLSGTRGMATMSVNASGLPGGAAGPGVPSVLEFTIDGNTLTFDLQAESGGMASMTGTVGQRDGSLVIDGVMAFGAEGAGIRADWSVTKQSGV